MKMGTVNDRQEKKNGKRLLSDTFYKVAYDSSSSFLALLQPDRTRPSSPCLLSSSAAGLLRRPQHPSSAATLSLLDTHHYLFICSDWKFRNCCCLGVSAKKLAHLLE
ncbi:unnamed protein product [Coffea canephora]|uniref:Uncharacterized protein n=1 Tax=Coffea canephora TaxID=49390 RepID=A0A068V1E9_COFCA|nr:unnamed protein product [Coffea canephora]